MGYYTRHELEVAWEHDRLIQVFREDCEEARYALEEDGSSSDSCKWYSHEDDLRAFSAKHPDVLFQLTGEGEEAGDLWVEYHKGGKMQKCKAQITYDAFSASELV